MNGNDPHDDNGQNLKHFWTNLNNSLKFFSQFILNIIDLSKGVDKQAVIVEISNNKSMAGANAWMLMASIVIASIGLDMDSPAVIIGAMLISPLMAPILGLGLGVGINDRETIKKSLFHFCVALFIAISTSTLYFFLTPFGDITDQIARRTEPNPMDMLIAFFGGIAGIISYARKDLSTTLPGVAIATALMPPICVTGFGIATGNWSIALSSFYLFFLNTFFITIATYVIVRFLRLPYRKYVNRKERTRNTLYTIFITLLVAIPSFMILRTVLEKETLKHKIEQFITENIGQDQIFLDSYTTGVIDSTNFLILKVYGDAISVDHVPDYKNGLRKLGLDHWDIKIIPTSEVDLDRVNSIEDKLSGLEKISTKYDVVIKEKEDQNIMIETLQKKLSELKMDSSSFNQVCLELKIIYPDIEELSFGNVQTSNYEAYDDQTFVLIIKWTVPRNSVIRKKEDQILKFIKTRLQINDVIIISK